jgi:hypothetical protein
MIFKKKLISKSISNGFAFYVLQNMEFANSQINMAKIKRVNLQWFPIIHLAKTKIMDPTDVSVMMDRSWRSLLILRGVFPGVQ